MSGGKGCLPPDPEKLASHPDAEDHPTVARRLGAHLDGSKPLSPSADKLPRVDRLDQGASSSCTWGSSSACVYQACTSLGIDIGGIPSQQAGYSETLAEVRRKATPQGQNLPPLEDVGADLEDVWVVYATEGVRPMKCQLTPDGRRYDLWTDVDTGGHPPGNVCDEPDPRDIASSIAIRVVLDVGPHTISPLDPAMSDKIAAALDADPPIPVEVAGLVDSAFEKLKAGQVAQPPNRLDPRGGGHAIRLSAYRPSASRPGEREFKVENSWGERWCEPGYTRGDGASMPGGFCWASEAWARSLWGIWVVNPKVLRSPLTLTEPPPATEKTPGPGFVAPVLAGLGSAALVLGGLWACTPGPVVPVADADAQPAPSVEAGPLPASGGCAEACVRLAKFKCQGGSDPLCAPAYTLIDQRGLRREPSGAPLTCEDIALASTRAAIVALGIGCE